MIVQLSRKSPASSLMLLYSPVSNREFFLTTFVTYLELHSRRSATSHICGQWGPQPPGTLPLQSSQNVLPKTGDSSVIFCFPHCRPFLPTCPSSHAGTPWPAPGTPCPYHPNPAAQGFSALCNPDGLAQSIVLPGAFTNVLSVDFLLCVQNSISS